MSGSRFVNRNTCAAVLTLLLSILTYTRNESKMHTSLLVLAVVVMVTYAKRQTFVAFTANVIVYGFFSKKYY